MEMIIFNINDRKENYKKDLPNETEARHWVINHLDTSEDWAICPIPKNVTPLLMEEIEEGDKFLHQGNIFTAHTIPNRHTKFNEIEDMEQNWLLNSRYCIKISTLEDDSRLIAEFRGYELNHDKTLYYIPQERKGMDIKWYKVKDLKYNTWNELMPIVEYIESLNFEINGIITSFDVTIVYGDCHIKDEDGAGIFEVHIHSTDSKNKFESVYKAIIEFIKWYNLNKKSS